MHSLMKKNPFMTLSQILILPNFIYLYINHKGINEYGINTGIPKTVGDVSPIKSESIAIPNPFQSMIVQYNAENKLVTTSIITR